MKERKVSVRCEPAILVAVVTADQEEDFDDLAELAALADTASGKVVGKVVQRRARIDPQFYLGKGKVEELRARAEELQAETVIFDNDLSPAQVRNLEQALQRKVIDRSELILDIFATHARTREACLQVGLAQMQYTYPRLRAMWTHLERIAGAGGGTGAGAVGGIGTRGPGEQQLEVDRRLVRRKIDQFKRQLQEIDERKLREVASRGDQFTVCLVGYTNAGKSTLMNALTGAGVYVEDKLFATLDTRTRRWSLGDGMAALLSDTVGFIRRLPHHLVASFRATLEEAIHADLLLHVVDAADPRAENQVAVVNGVLKELGCDEKNVLMVFNKADLVSDPAALQVLRRRAPAGVATSAVTGQGLAELTERVRWYYLRPSVSLTLDVEPGAGKLLSYLKTRSQVHHADYGEERVRVEVTLSADRLGPLRRFAGEFTLLESSEPTVAAILAGQEET